MSLNRSDIIHYYHLGCPVEYLIINPLDGEIARERLGPDILSGQKLQVLIPGGCWRCGRMLTMGSADVSSDGYTLTSEAVAPGFDYADNQLATREEISDKFNSSLVGETGNICPLFQITVLSMDRINYYRVLWSACMLSKCTYNSQV